MESDAAATNQANAPTDDPLAQNEPEGEGPPDGNNLDKPGD